MAKKDEWRRPIFERQLAEFKARMEAESPDLPTVRNSLARSSSPEKRYKVPRKVVDELAALRKRDEEAANRGFYVDSSGDESSEQADPSEPSSTSTAIATTPAEHADRKKKRVARRKAKHAESKQKAEEKRASDLEKLKKILNKSELRLLNTDAGRSSTSSIRRIAASRKAKKWLADSAEPEDMDDAMPDLVRENTEPGQRREALMESDAPRQTRRRGQLWNPPRGPPSPRQKDSQSPDKGSRLSGSVRTRSVSVTMTTTVTSKRKTLTFVEKRSAKKQKMDDGLPLDGPINNRVVDSIEYDEDDDTRDDADAEESGESPVKVSISIFPRYHCTVF